MHTQITGKHGLTSLITTWTWGKSPPSPYNIFCAWSKALHPNAILFQDSQVGSSEIPEMGTPTTLEAHHFLCRPSSMEVGFKAKLYPLTRAFQQYVARHLHTRKSKRFLIFLAIGYVLSTQMGHVISF